MLGVAPASGSSEDVPRLVELAVPQPAAGEVLVRVAASGVNHVDLLQQRGRYPVPDGESLIPGLECSGVVAALGEGVSPGQPWDLGERVMALLGGGGHAQYVAVPERQLMRLPPAWDPLQGAALPEAGLTAWTNLVAEGDLRRDEWVMVTAATGGVGTFAVQLAEALGARVVAVARSLERLRRLRLSPSSVTVQEGADFVARVHTATEGTGVDLIVDLVGGTAFEERLQTLRPHGRVVLVGLLAGIHSELDLSRALRCQLNIKGSLLRARSRQEKGRLVEAFVRFAWPRLLDGSLVPSVAASYPAREIEMAYQALSAGGLGGKVVVRWDDDEKTADDSAVD